MKEMSPYREAHLFTAAVRILEYRRQSPPSIEDVAQMLSVSAEEANRIFRSLKSRGIMDSAEKGGETRLFIADHMRIEEIEDTAGKSGISEELEKFRREKESRRRSIDELKNSQELKRRKVMEEIERKLKDNMPDGPDQKK